jgi:hypothetical protein
MAQTRDFYNWVIEKVKSFVYYTVTLTIIVVILSFSWDYNFWWGGGGRPVDDSGSCMLQGN